MALVRARRLVFEGDVYFDCDTSLGKYTINHRLDGLWNAKRRGCNICEPVQTQQDAIAVCQRDFDKRWESETEVLPLEWTDHSESSIASDSTGSYFVEYNVNSNGFWIWDAPGTKAERCDSRESGKHLCNEHNRKTILGE